MDTSFDTYSSTPEYYGQATDSGHYDDVEMYGDDGMPNHLSMTGGAHRTAWLLIVLALAMLWVMGAALFKGSNNS